MSITKELTTKISQMVDSALEISENDMTLASVILDKAAQRVGNSLLIEEATDISLQKTRDRIAQGKPFG